MNVIAGVDCHKESHTIVVVNAVGTQLAHFEIPTTVAGHSSAIATVGEYGDAVWGLEGSGSFGRPFAEFLVKHDYMVYDVPGLLTKRNRQRSSRIGKSDPIDALAIAQSVLRESDRLPRFFGKSYHDIVRICHEERTALVRERTQAINRLRSEGLQLGVVAMPSKLITKRTLAVAEKLARSVQVASVYDRQVVAQMHRLIARIRVYIEQIAECDRSLKLLLRDHFQGLRAMRGVSYIVASGLIGEAGDLRNCRNADAFAMRAATAPIPCSSGRNAFVRLNARGNRQLNKNIHTIAMIQVRSKDHLGRQYYDRKRAEGKSHNVAMRALKRRLATVVFYRLKEGYDALGARPAIAA